MKDEEMTAEEIEQQAKNWDVTLRETIEQTANKTFIHGGNRDLRDIFKDVEEGDIGGLPVKEVGHLGIYIMPLDENGEKIGTLGVMRKALYVENRKGLSGWKRIPWKQVFEKLTTN